MSDPQSTAAWLALGEELQSMPGTEEDELRWGERLVLAARAALAARAIVLLLPARAGGLAWQRWTAAPGGATAVTASLSGPPAGWIGAVARAHAPVATMPFAAASPEPEWDGLAPAVHAADGLVAGAPVPIAGRPDGALLAVMPVTAPVPAPASATSAAPAARAAAEASVMQAVHGLARILGRALDLRARFDRLSSEVITDELTGAYNYRYLGVALRRELRRAARFSQPLSVAMLDVDHLKEYNERFGHLRGSAVLKQLAGAVQAGIRDIDLLAKYGGDEFLLILPQTDKRGARALADRLRRRVAAEAFPQLERGAITCSIGVATFPDDADRPEALIAAADQALFAAKRMGRNRVSAA